MWLLLKITDINHHTFLEKTIARCSTMSQVEEMQLQLLPFQNLAPCLWNKHCKIIKFNFHLCCCMFTNGNSFKIVQLCLDVTLSMSFTTYGLLLPSQQAGADCVLVSVLGLCGSLVNSDKGIKVVTFLCSHNT